MSPLRCFLLCTILLARPALAGCSRTIVVPMAPIGIGVVADQDGVHGIYPSVLQDISTHTGCIFKTSLVPQARLELLFETGQADVLMPAIGTHRRDEFGAFLPLLGTRAMLVSLDGKRPAVASLADLLLRRELRVAAVRGNDYGQRYQDVIAELGRQGRLLLEADPLHVGRLLAAGLADAALITPMSLAAALKEDAKLKPLLGKVRMEALPELGWQDSGVYLSRKSLGDADREFLAAQLRAAFKADKVWEQYKRYYSPEILAASARLR
ncbi:MAG: hypothetical protein V4463_07080 [Pseudomonadota bacterium]